MGGCGREAVDAKTDRHLVLSVQLHEDYLFGLSCKLMRAIVIGPYTDVETGTEGFVPKPLLHIIPVPHVMDWPRLFRISLPRRVSTSRKG